MDLLEHFRKGMVRGLVQMHITCPLSGDILDMDTCVVILDSDGDPCRVFSQRAWKGVTDLAEQIGVPPLAEGYTVDESTVR